MEEELKEFKCPKCGEKFDGSDFKIEVFDEISDIEVQLVCCDTLYSTWVSPKDFYLQG